MTVVTVTTVGYPVTVVSPGKFHPEGFRSRVASALRPPVGPVGLGGKGEGGKFRHPNKIPLTCIIHESRVKNPETTTRYKLQRLDLNNSLFCLSVTGLSGEKIMVKKAEKRGQKTL
ncbi:hypothetical protein H0901_07660 [Microcystis aeruginosa BLCCF158]|uniref:Uncharacterized protein n=1 Tax=Microcystis aeruginosa BLCC-F158 TaxID=2755316 RepID=A0A841UYM7_MICAE|nr:hypothetical protein [Microcystis aeruginosa]MBC1195158.1 hypothetical protein [Microcystis aeruginosa BLCC-F158]